MAGDKTGGLQDRHLFLLWISLSPSSREQNTKAPQRAQCRLTAGSEFSSSGKQLPPLPVLQYGSGHTRAGLKILCVKLLSYTGRNLKYPYTTIDITIAEPGFGVKSCFDVVLSVSQVFSPDDQRRALSANLQSTTCFGLGVIVFLL
jgi:hypothetical protein